MVLFNNPSNEKRSHVLSKLTRKFTRDCRDMQVHFVVLPRAKTISSVSPFGARYSIFTPDRASWERCWGDMCMQISVEFPYLSFETPFTSSFIFVKPENVKDVPVWVRHCLLPTRITRRGRLDFCRMHHHSLWRIEDSSLPSNRKPRTLEPHEVDILIRWQKDGVVHDALDINPETNCPRSIFGEVLSQIAEHTNRLQVVAYRHLQRVPPHLLRSEIADWPDSLGAVARHMPQDMKDVAGNTLTAQQQYDQQARRHAEKPSFNPFDVFSDVLYHDAENDGNADQSPGQSPRFQFPRDHTASQSTPEFTNNDTAQDMRRYFDTNSSDGEDEYETKGGNSIEDEKEDEMEDESEGEGGDLSEDDKEDEMVTTDEEEKRDEGEEDFVSATTARQPGRKTRVLDKEAIPLQQLKKPKKPKIKPTQGTVPIPLGNLPTEHLVYHQQGRIRTRGFPKT